ncbi:asparagine synthetase B [candidate division WOR-3 bacterium]|uniref:Asparagine synthetase B n=1 Tax=candidate division WOR-3 bacterium TaxID=2052148 RepID=A0A660SH36_UNCW3|nr:MAG: asparagine synthetase B [candidate division WOR-3 bacterium]
MIPILIFTLKLLIPMDLKQTDHLKAYGVAYRALKHSIPVEWLINYRGGSFLTEYEEVIVKDCLNQGVYFERVSSSEVLQIYQTIKSGNMESILLEKAPKIAVYIPHHYEPWDDAVALALDYAGIPYDRVWDPEVLKGKLSQYDWLHLHHEDFTGQFGKFYGSYRNEEWYQEEVRINQEMAQRFGFPSVPALKLAVAKRIKEYIERGGFVFSMCSACDTYEIALAAEGTDIWESVYDGDPPDPDFPEKLDYSKCLAFTDFKLITSPYIYEHSDIDVTKEADRRGEFVFFSLFDFSAKFDPVPTMLVQNHTSLVREFLGQCTGFHKSRIKKSVVILGEVEGTDEVKYLHGNYGKGSFTYLGGHDPEDFRHFVHDPPTDLSRHKNSPGYRLILNNILYPAARKKKLKT